MASQANRGKSPDFDGCHLERILEHLYRCLSNKSKCRYALKADATRTYCRYPDKSGFKHVNILDAAAVGQNARQYEFDCTNDS